jgi:hypothetical protein
VTLLLTGRSLGTLFKRLLKLGHPFSHLCKGIPSYGLCLWIGLEWAFLTPLGLECTVFLVLGTFASIVSTSRAPMFLAQVAVFLNASLLRNLVGRRISVLAFPVLVGVSVRFRVSPVVSVGGALGYGGTRTKLLNVLKNSEESACVLWNRVLVQIILILPVHRTHT